eukprot:GHVN01027075.1.p1 GENE.GHVN01027075.1~~GHVN01027075.1.p1  ORF type:complete len:291 (+),score=26.31 GHVN01027075.1:303-1175(+)
MLEMLYQHSQLKKTVKRRERMAKVDSLLEEHSLSKVSRELIADAPTWREVAKELQRREDFGRKVPVLSLDPLRHCTPQNIRSSTRSLDESSDDGEKGKRRASAGRKRRFRNEAEWMRHLLVFGVTAVAAGHIDIAGFLSHADNALQIGATMSTTAMILYDQRKRHDMSQFTSAADRSAEEVFQRWADMDATIHRDLLTYESRNRASRQPSSNEGDNSARDKRPQPSSPSNEAQPSQRRAATPSSSSTSSSPSSDIRPAKQQASRDDRQFCQYVRQQKNCPYGDSCRLRHS